MVIIRTRLVSKIHASAVTVWPLLFVEPTRILDRRLRVHEETHARQQIFMAALGALIWVALGVVTSWPFGAEAVLLLAKWFALGWLSGLLAFGILYLLVLPVGWNKFREWSERQAMRAEGHSDAEIDIALREPPYYLWWM